MQEKLGVWGGGGEDGAVNVNDANFGILPLCYANQ